MLRSPSAGSRRRAALSPSTAAVVSDRTRMNPAAFAWAAGSSAMPRRNAALRPDWLISSRSDREVTPRAAELLDQVLDGPLILAEDLPTPTDAERKAPKH